MSVRNDARNDTGGLGQQGIASLIITMVTMVIISLVVIGFATISRREQRQSLDQQLSTQAFYAAESGVADAKNVIDTLLATNATQPIPAKPDCTTDPSGKYPTGDMTRIDIANGVEYTCLTVDPSPTYLQYNGVSENNLTIPVNTDRPITSIRVTWTPVTAPAASTPSSGCPSSVDHTLRQQSSWNCGYGLLRADMTPTQGFILNRKNLVDNTVTGFFEPTTVTSASGTINYAASLGKPNLVAAKCVGSGPTGSYGSCQATIDNVSSVAPTQKVSLRLSSLYQPSNLKVEAFNGIQLQKINGVQATIDSTGKAQDVLRRIQVRLPVASKSAIPNYALQSNGSICKHFLTAPGYFEIPDTIVDPDLSNPLCDKDNSDVGPLATPASCTNYKDLAMVLDVSGSMQNNWDTGPAIDELRRVALQLVANSDITTANNHSDVISFNDTAKVQQSLTSNTGQLNSAIKALTASGGTNYLPGLNAAANEFATKGRGAPIRPVIVFISDGAPRDAKPAIRSAIAALKATGVIVYTIGITPPTYDPAVDIPPDPVLLGDMAGNGGTYVNASSESSLSAAVANIATNLSCI